MLLVVVWNRPQAVKFFSLLPQKYICLFEKEDIGLQELPLMTENRLKSLGLPLGPRLRLLEEIKTAFGNSTPSFLV